MENSNFDYGYITDLGQFFIPQNIQEHSEIKTSQQGKVTLVMCDVENDHITLKYHSTVSLDEHKKMQSGKPEGLRAVDDIGRVILSPEQRQMLGIGYNTILMFSLLSDGTVIIKPTVTVTYNELVES
jgi:bifunctional DNA-binding transcriptional regulator/antitoxin component of YhaV-PrlF toxin-antitoxin module